MNQSRYRCIACSVLGLTIAWLIGAASITALAQESPIQFGPPGAMNLPAVQHFSLGNGLRVVLMENHKVPLVQIEMMVKGGSVLDPPDRAGLSSMTADMMEEGAGARNSLEYADAVDFLGASISAYSSSHSSGVSLFTPLSKLDSAVALFADMVLRPGFPADELERLRKERLTTLVQWHDEARAIASVLFNRTLFGGDHPYGRPSLGDERSIRSITADDVRGFHRRIYTPGNATIIVVGDVRPAEIMAVLELYFGQWSPGSSPGIIVPKAGQVSGRTIHLVDKPGAAQSEIRIGRIGVDRFTPDYFPIQVMNTILGGSFASRLNQNLRERNGFTYGAASWFDARMSAGPFQASAAVQTDVTDRALREFINEFEAIRKPVPADELVRARNYLALLYPNSFETISRTAGELAELVAYDLPDDYFNTYVDRVLNVSGDEVERIAREQIDPEDVAIIVVGDREKIEAGIAALHLGEIRIYTIEDVLGPVPVLEDGQ